MMKEEEQYLKTNPVIKLSGNYNQSSYFSFRSICKSSQDIRGSYLKISGLLPSRVLYVNQQANGFAVWYTPPQ
jgi:hypothetical protein